ncbi:DNA-binding PucR family transcriptional regulator [Prauserella shujinwangii]|uniref:DNA-binding PucR family transcriptional regulator n=1 Tax=Prauserella shujinwangii TaxID=1453103 RepID=A0A2T0M1F3_9PSEU|nr:helix-turn-helix domain-containing protein [Prauserella shujinwangii]PRX50415.1 DNA-binding PucR family transcriptional regulator [Prauserella shujinwangii]
MSVPVRRLLALPEWAGTVRVMAGAEGLDRTVALPRPVSDLSPEHTVGAGELVVATGPMPQGDWRIDALLRRVADAAGAGVLLPATALLEGTRRLADRLAVPLLTATSEPLDLLVAARLLLAEPELDRAELVLATHRALGERPRPPEEVVTALATVLRAPVALLDDGGTPVAGELRDPGLVRVAEPVPQRVALDDGVLLAHPVPLPSAPRPALWLATELRGAAAERAESVPQALAVAAGAAQRWLLTHRLELERDARARSALLGDLLRIDGEPGDDLRRRAADAGWRLGGWHVGIRIGTTSAVDNVARGAEVTRALRAVDIDAIVVEHGDGWTAWITVDEEPTATRVRALGKRLRAAHHELRATMGAHMGVGRPHAGPDGLAATVAEASDAARLAATRPESGTFLHVDQLGMAQLLLEWTRTDTFEPAARALLAPLRGQPGDLVRTLATYLDAESSITETAAVLGVHRNTVAARIERVERELGVDLRHRDERLALHLACRTVTLADS